MNTLITGCRSGFGLHMAREAARAGHVVYAGLRDLSTADELVETCRGLPVIPIQLDITDAEQRQAAVDRMLKDHGRIDGLVNNAGTPLGGFLEQVEEDEIRKVFDVNVFGTFSLTKAVLPTMRKQRSGSIIMVSSMSGRMALPCLGTYAASKFALEGMSEAWRHELAPFGIQVVLLEPGAYKTDIWGRNRHLCRNAKDPDGPYAAWVEHVDAVIEEESQKRAGDPVDVAHKTVQLLSDPNPPLRVPLGKDAKNRQRLIRWVPFGFIERGIARKLTPKDAGK